MFKVIILKIFSLVSNMEFLVYDCVANLSPRKFVIHRKKSHQATTYHR